MAEDMNLGRNGRSGVFRERLLDWAAYIRGKRKSRGKALGFKT